jgi:hypothetical protein
MVQRFSKLVRRRSDQIFTTVSIQIPDFIEFCHQLNVEATAYPRRSLMIDVTQFALEDTPSLVEAIHWDQLTHYSIWMQTCITITRCHIAFSISAKGKSLHLNEEKSKQIASSAWITSSFADVLFLKTFRSLPSIFWSRFKTFDVSFHVIEAWYAMSSSHTPWHFACVFREWIQQLWKCITWIGVSLVNREI